MQILTQANPIRTHDAVTAGSTVEIDCHGYTALIIVHEMTGATTGGYVEVEFRTSPGATGVTHPAPAGNSDFGLNVKTAATATNYVSIIRGLTSRVGIKLNRTDGTHTVTVIPCHV